MCEASSPSARWNVRSYQSYRPELQGSSWITVLYLVSCNVKVWCAHPKLRAFAGQRFTTAVFSIFFLLIPPLPSCPLFSLSTIPHHLITWPLKMRHGPGFSRSLVLLAIPAKALEQRPPNYGPHGADLAARQKFLCGPRTHSILNKSLGSTRIYR